MAPQPIYRITSSGRAVAAWEQHAGKRTAHLLDLLHMLQNSGHGVPEAHLRQFMPLETLMRSIACLVALGLVEFNETPAMERASGPPAGQAATRSH